VNIATRHICFAILVGLLLSHTGIAVHAATHAPAVSGECELCSAYGDATSVVELARAQSFQDFNGLCLASLIVSSPEPRFVASFDPRGPPRQTEN